MLQIEQVSSFEKFRNFFRQRDGGIKGDGLLDKTEINKKIIKKFDQNGDNKLSPWEVMVAANVFQRRIVFNHKQIIEEKIANSNGQILILRQKKGYQAVLSKGAKFNVPFWNEEKTSFPKGTTVHFDKRGKLKYILLVADQKISGIDLHAGTVIELTDDGNIKSLNLWPETKLFGLKLSRGTQAEFTFEGLEIVFESRDKIQGIPYEKGTKVVFYYDEHVTAANGKVKQIMLGDKFQTGKNTYPRKTTLTFYNNGHLKSAGFVSDQEVWIKQLDKKISVSKDGGISFYQNGNAEFVHLVGDTEINGMTFANWNNVWFHDNGTIREGFLAFPQTMQGYKCQKHSVEFHSNGKLAHAWLSEDQEIQGFKCAKDNYISFYGNGKLERFTLAKRTKIQNMFFPEGTEVSFNENGKLFYAESVDIKGVRWIYPAFYENGRLKSGSLESSQKIQGILFPEVTKIFFRDDGTIEYVESLPKQQIIKKIPCAKDSFVFFHPNGRIERVSDLFQDYQYKGMKAKWDNPGISFHPNGRLGDITLLEPHKLQGVLFSKNSRLSFYDNGRLHTAELFLDLIIQGKKCSKDSVVVFWKNGKIQKCTLAIGQVVQGIHYPKGTELCFDKNGKMFDSSEPF